MPADAVRAQCIHGPKARDYARAAGEPRDRRATRRSGVSFVEGVPASRTGSLKKMRSKTGKVKVPDKQATTGATIPSPKLLQPRQRCGWGDQHEHAAADRRLQRLLFWGMGVGDLVTERAPDLVDGSHSETDEVKQISICARITEVRDGQQTDLGGNYHFEQLPAPNNQIVILNRRGSYDIMRVLYLAHEPETSVYVRWVARR